jgi:cytochrome c oxidase subunit 1
VVHHRDAFWEQKHGKAAKLVRHQHHGGGHGHGIHLPPPSVYPILMAAGFVATYTIWLTAAGLALMIFCLFAMAFEPIS